MSEKNEYVGKVINHDTHGYGVVWRADKFNRLSVKFANGKEIGAFEPDDMNFIDRDTIKKDDIISKLGDSGLADFIDMGECKDLITRYFKSQGNFSKVLRKSLDGVYPLYIVGEKPTILKNIYKENLADSDLKENFINGQLRIMDNLKSSFQVVKYISSKFIEVSEHHSMPVGITDLYALDSTLSKIIEKLSIDGRIGK